MFLAHVEEQGGCRVRLAVPKAQFSTPALTLNDDSFQYGEVVSENDKRVKRKVMFLYIRVFSQLD